MLQKAMDPPDPEVVDDALNLLVHIKALRKSTTHRGRYEPTYYGRLLASISLSFDAAHLILKFGDIGMLREGILIGILMDQQPVPIFHPFGQDFLFKEYIESYFRKDNDNMVLTGRKEIIFMENLCAYQFWQRVFKENTYAKDLLNTPLLDFEYLRLVCGEDLATGSFAKSNSDGQSENVAEEATSEAQDVVPSTSNQPDDNPPS